MRRSAGGPFPTQSAPWSAPGHIRWSPCRPRGCLQSFQNSALGNRVSRARYAPKSSCRPAEHMPPAASSSHSSPLQSQCIWSPPARMSRRWAPTARRRCRTGRFPRLQISVVHHVLDERRVDPEAVIPFSDPLLLLRLLPLPIHHLSPGSIELERLHEIYLPRAVVVLVEVVGIDHFKRLF